MLIGRCKDIPHLHQRILRLLDLTDRQVGIGIDQTCGQPQGQIFVGEIQFCFTRRLFGLASKVVIFRQRDVPQSGILDPLHVFHALARRKCRVHQRHRRTAQGRCRLRRCRL